MRANTWRWLALGLYGTVVIAGAARHEPWADEAQSWLLARDATPLRLWGTLLHYEGTPGLWHTLLQIFIAAGGSYAGLSYVSAACGIAGAALLIWKSPLPLPAAILLPFSYYLCYQYAVIARSYSLLPPLLFGCAICVVRRRAAWLTAMLCLLAAVSAHGLILSALVAACYLIGMPGGWRLIGAYAAVSLLMAWTAWPAPDATFVRAMNWSGQHLWTYAQSALREALAGNALLSAAALLLSVPFLYRGGALLFFVLGAAMICVFGSVVYGTLWHHGTLLAAWVFALWVASGRATMDALSMGAVALVLAVQIYWSGAALTYDWTRSYSGSKETARYLRSHSIIQRGLWGFAYNSTAVQPYFSRNIFENFNGGRREAYWDWSSRNRTLENREALAAMRPPYVLVGYIGVEDRLFWTGFVKRCGYRSVAHFEGSPVWHDRLAESESFDLYRLQ